MKIFVEHNWPSVKDFDLKCESTDTIAHVKAKVHDIEGIPPDNPSLVFDGKQMDDNFSENMTLADIGVQEGSMIELIFPDCRRRPLCYVVAEMAGGLVERPLQQKPENDCLYYADAFKSGWREEHAKELLQLLLKLCQDGTISEGNVTDEAWRRIQNGLETSMNCSFQIDFLKQRLCDYKQLYSTLAETNSPVFHWDRKRKKICRIGSDWREYHPELLLLCGAYIPYFDTLEEVCKLLNASRSSEQQVCETSTNINNNEQLVNQDISRLSNIITVHVSQVLAKLKTITCVSNRNYD